jgi:hypothetical protein
VLAGTFSARDCQTRLVVDGPDGQSIDVVALASAVYRYWLVVITAHGG